MHKIIVEYPGTMAGLLLDAQGVDIMLESYLLHKLESIST